MICFIIYQIIVFFTSFSFTMHVGRTLNICWNCQILIFFYINLIQKISHCMHFNCKIVIMFLSQITYHLLVVVITCKGKWTAAEDPLLSESDVSPTDTVQIWFLGSVLCVPWFIFGPSEVPGCLGLRHRHQPSNQFFMFNKLSLKLLVSMNIFLFKLSKLNLVEVLHTSQAFVLMWHILFSFLQWLPLSLVDDFVMY